MYLDYNVSSGPFLSYEIEIGDGLEPELDNSIALMRNALCPMLGPTILGI